ncbi:hypothetical protein M231_05252 [Tremella mesenterica]|uniref:Major facilitator superfamily (MFS) profile domain-containing protein n=1 Tax=Tremella mesenterica TaxID=5217 RepID=A0A4Q1BIM7_TREME|nr:hypothetical protein M231_05252 [Tremella mesenterica]
MPPSRGSSTSTTTTMAEFDPSSGPSPSKPSPLRRSSDPPPSPIVPSPHQLPHGCSYGPPLPPHLHHLLPSSLLPYPPDIPHHSRKSKEHISDTVTTATSSQQVSPISQGSSSEKTVTNPTEIRIIWVDFPPQSTKDPFHFPVWRKTAIVCVASFFTLFTAFSVSGYSIGIESMSRDLGCTTLQAQVGLGLYAWGFGIAPLVLAPISEEFGRRWAYLVAIVMYTVLIDGAQNTATILVVRFLLGVSGSVGATLVGGTISDIYEPQDRGWPMSIFSVCALCGSGIAAPLMACVEATRHLEWRWIQWIQMIVMTAYIPFVYFVLRETRAPVILRRRAKHLRDQRGLQDGGRYTARSEIDKVGFGQAVRTSLYRPILFLFTEPVVLFFSCWVSLGWAVLYVELDGLDFIFSRVYNFSIKQVGLVYLVICIGGILGFILNFWQDALIYRRKFEKRGVEARLYAPMIGGITLAGGCYMFAFTSRSDIHWIVPCIAQVIIFASIFTIYIVSFVYVAECYGSYASSAIAGNSFLRNMVGGGLSFGTTQIYEKLTPKWAIFLFGSIAAVLAIVPFVAFFYGPIIRARSPYSKLLMAEERERMEQSNMVSDMAQREIDDDDFGGGERGRGVSHRV